MDVVGVASLDVLAYSTVLALKPRTWQLNIANSAHKLFRAITAELVHVGRRFWVVLDQVVYAHATILTRIECAGQLRLTIGPRVTYRTSAAKRKRVDVHACPAVKAWIAGTWLYSTLTMLARTEKIKTCGLRLLLLLTFSFYTRTNLE